MLTYKQGRLGLIYKLAILAYILAVVVVSYRAGLTIVAKICALILVGLFVFRAVSAGERPFVPREFKLAGAWFLLGVVSSLLSPDPSTTLARIGTMLQVLPIAWVISNFIFWNGDGRFYWVGIVIAGVVSGLITMLNLGDSSTIDGRVYGTLANANAFGALLVVVLILTLSAIMATRVTILQLGMLALAAGFLFLIGKTGSRMSMLGAIVGIGVVFYCYQVSARSRGASRAVAVILLGGLAIAGGAYYLSSSEFSDRLESLRVATESGDFRRGDNSLQIRSKLYAKAFDMALDRPLIGWGLDTFKDAQIILGFRLGNNAHSNYVEILQSTGIVGVILYFAIYQSWLSRLFRMRSLLSEREYAARFTAAGSIAIVFLVFDIAWVTYYEKLVWMIFAGLIAEVHLLGRSMSQGAHATARPPMMKWSGRAS